MKYNWYYGLLVCYEGFDEKSPHDEQDRDTYEIFELFAFSDFYDMIKESYKDDSSVRIYNKFECDEYDAEDRMDPFRGLSWDASMDTKSRAEAALEIESESSSDSSEEEVEPSKKRNRRRYREAFSPQSV